MACRHCGEGKVTRPRGLCWACFYEPGVRDLYPFDSKYAKRGFDAMRFHPVPPPFATNAIPGSPEKVAILTQRAEMGQDLFHPDDATMCGRRSVPKVG